MKRILIALLLGIPHNHVEAFVASVEGVGTVVDGHLILNAVEGELTVLDAVAIPADGGSEEALAVVVHILVEGFMSEHDVGIVAVAVGSEEFNDKATEVGDGHLQTIGVLQCVEVYLLTVYF